MAKQYKSTKEGLMEFYEGKAREKSGGLLLFGGTVHM